MFFYVESLVIYFFCNAIFLLGLNLQFGLAGILNLAYIAFFALGAYTASILSIGSPNSAMAHEFSQHYLFGATLPWPIPVFIAMFVVVAFSYFIGKFVIRNMRTDFIALATIAIMQIAYNTVNNVGGIFNGPTGLAGIPAPLQAGLHVSDTRYAYIFMGMCAVWCALAYFVAEQISKAPLGRVYRSLRENSMAAAALGKNGQRLRLQAFMLGGAFAGVAGALFVEYLSVWAPSAWAFPETVLLFAALYIGGRGNNKGILLGTFIVYVILFDLFKLFPPVGGNPVISASLQWIYIGALLIAFIWFRPQGLIPERRTRWKSIPAATALAASPLVFNAGGLVDQVVPSTNDDVIVVNEEFRADSKRHRSGGEEQAKASLRIDGEIILRCEHVSKAYGGIQAVDHCTLGVAKGFATGLIGPNGAGKSTLIDIITGFTKLDSGEVWWGNENITGLPPFEIARRGIGRTFQKSSEFPRLSVLENMMVAPQHQLGESLAGVFFRPGKWRQEEAENLERARHLLARFGLTRMENEYARNLSGGQLRLLEMARALMSSPTMLFLDEPMAGVNPALGEEILTHLTELVAEGLTIILVEHELDIIERTCSNVLVMANGSLLAEGALSTLREDQLVIDAYLS